MSHKWILQEYLKTRECWWRCENCGSTDQDLYEYVRTYEFNAPVAPEDDILLWLPSFSTHINDKLSCEEIQAAQIMRS